MHDLPWLSLTTFLPLIGAAWILFLRGDAERVASQARFIALWTSLITFLLSLWVWALFDPTSADFQFVERSQWVPEYHINYHMGIDGISLFFTWGSTASRCSSCCSRPS